MNVSDFDYELPEERIAQRPPELRGTSRLMLLDRASGRVGHARFAELVTFLRRGDLLVLNNTRVFPARLLGNRVGSGGAVECLLIGHVEDDRWEALMHPGQKLRPGGRVIFSRSGVELHGEILERRFYGRRLIRLWTTDGRPVRDAIAAIGHVPLPPYIKRADESADRERYQTVFARRDGSVAAPTSGLHFTEQLLEDLDLAGVERCEITLHVGYGTFKPVRVEHVEQHTVDAEHWEITPAAAEAINRAIADRRRIIAVGTTTTRTLEAVAAQREGAPIESGTGATNLFIYPGHRFRIVSALVTNFHLPRSSLLMLVAAFAGREHVLAAYREAIKERYRFYSYGDAMFIS